MAVAVLKLYVVTLRYRTSGQGGGEDSEGFLDLDGGLGVMAGARQQGGQDVDVVGAEDDVDPRGPIDDAPPHLLGQAAGHGDLHAGALVLDGGEPAEVAEQAGDRVLAHGAGVDDDDVGAAVAGPGVPGGGLGHVLDALGCRSRHGGDSCPASWSGR